MFQGKTVIVTGSGAGIGKEAALQFARQGANVVINSISRSGASVCGEFDAENLRAIFVQADVSTEEGAAKVVSAAADAFGGIDVLVNNAGKVPSGGVESLSAEEWDQGMAVNVKSVFLMSKLCLPYLRRTKGCIIHVASAVALKGVAGRALYSASKGAILSLSRSMAREYVQDGVRVNCVSPGSVVTPSFQDRVNSAPDAEKAMEEFIARQPIGRLGTPQEVASAIVYLASPQAGYITGANLVIDGGMTM
ncbi:MAG: SDR family oxidoreductase [Bacillota bacterium]